MAQDLMKKGNRTEGLRNALAGRSAAVVHLTHNDLDAVGADAVHRMRYGEVFTIFSSVGAFPQMLAIVATVPGKGNILSITDLGYQNGIERSIKKAADAGWRIEWRDHHRWRDEELAAVTRDVSLLRVDTGTCATGIAARDLMADDPRAGEVARVVCDYDLWKNKDPRAAVLGRVTSREENRLYVRDLLVGGQFTDPHIARQYSDINREMEGMIGKSIRASRVFGSKRRVAFAPLYGYPSETAYALREKLGSDIEVIVSSTGRFSIRSVPPISHLIAREFGGGGHPHAAGGSFTFSIPEKILFILFKKVKKFNRLVEIAESI